ncbi:uncharacterized protein LOC143891884 [Tasmannia lanceolata]|uniref:uncharacterized protein LOC143891884 n=1 Tax=Tasmannia lanceolata TaxID=3420 RepID=UPI004063718C
MKIVSWNSNGLGSQGKRLQVKELINSSKPDLMCLQETKLELISRGVFRGLGFREEWDFDFIPSQGASGGILVAWNGSAWKLVNVWKGNFSLFVAFKKLEDGSDWLYSGVYGPCSREAKLEFWEELGRVRSFCQFPWCVGGDFNEIRAVEERIWCSRVSQNMQLFIDFIAENELIDLPMSGRAFTWARGESRSRIDRFFISSEWMEMVPDVFQKALLHSVSDHCPILLDPSWESWGPSPFRFDIAWLEISKMEETLGEWWGLRSFEGPADVVIGKN